MFGGWFPACLKLTIRAILPDAIVHHRRWMIRAFAVAVGGGTIRIWITLCRSHTSDLLTPGAEPAGRVVMKEPPT